jgi:hypothetical protein
MNDTLPSAYQLHAAIVGFKSNFGIRIRFGYPGQPSGLQCVPPGVNLIK